MTFLTLVSHYFRRKYFRIKCPHNHYNWKKLKLFNKELNKNYNFICNGELKKMFIVFYKEIYLEVLFEIFFLSTAV